MQLGMDESAKTASVGRPPSPHPRGLYATNSNKNNNNKNNNNSNNNNNKNNNKTVNAKNTKGMCFLTFMCF